MPNPVPGPGGKMRCSWSIVTPEYVRYHDTEWGFPVVDDQRLFEKICLEGFQSGLSWRTILAKREDFRRVFHDFDYDRVATFKEKDVERLLQDASIIRHRGKIEATINNAKRTQEMIKSEGSLAAYFWSYEPDEETLPPPQTITTSPESIAISKDLKKRGWKFVGPTTVFAFIQAMGLINDHVEGCVTREKVEKARKKLKRPR
ncbi:MAG: DNA-3-methyladenine glycosylase I [Pseudomonadota bacterium]|nr:DNA-3-methyladenine glycosylase I [Pseudomonadota bacterium]